MTDEISVDIAAAMAEDYSPRRDQRRRNSLTNEDLDAISAIVEATLRHRRHDDADCRFSGITPEDLKAMVEAHKKFNAAMDDSKSIVRRFVVVLILTSISGVAIYGWWAKLTDTVKKSIIPGN